jgi:hypothetical protein
MPIVAVFPIDVRRISALYWLFLEKWACLFALETVPPLQNCFDLSPIAHGVKVSYGSGAKVWQRLVGPGLADAWFCIGGAAGRSDGVRAESQ